MISPEENSYAEGRQLFDRLIECELNEEHIDYLIDSHLLATPEFILYNHILYIHKNENAALTEVAMLPPTEKRKLSELLK